MIPVGYWLAGIGFLLVIPLVRQDLDGRFVKGELGMLRKSNYGLFAIVIVVMVVTLFVVSIVYKD